MRYHPTLLAALAVAGGVAIAAFVPDALDRTMVAPALAEMADLAAQGADGLMDLGVAAVMLGAFCVVGPVILMMIYLLGVGHLPTRPARDPEDPPPVIVFSQQAPPIARQALLQAGASRTKRKAG